MSEKRRRLLLLYEACLLSRKEIWKLLKFDKELTVFHSCSEQDFIHSVCLRKPSAYKLHRWLKNKPFEHCVALPASYYHCLTIFDAGYPSVLKSIPDPPLVLYFKGNPHLLKHLPSISVVGTRKPSEEAYVKMQNLLLPLIANEWMIVSGMAKGIDSYAHQLALQKQGKTIAVMGAGLLHIYPPENTSLFNSLAQEQLIISEYPAHLPPKRFYFPERNRIISGLGFATLVVEAEEKSGSLITADQALEQGRDVFAIPGSPLSPQAQGVNKLIQQGAKLINHPEDILEEWKGCL